jgi:hypothetical protein
MKSQNNEIQRLDSEREAQRQTVQGLQRKLEAQREHEKELREKRDAIAYAAHTGDASAAKALEQIRSALLTATLECEELQIAIGEAERKFLEISAARETAYLAEEQRKFDGLIQEKLDAAKKVQEAMDALIAVERLEQAINEKLAALGAELGVEKAFGKHFAESIGGQIYKSFPASRTGNFPPRIYMEKDYREIVYEFLKEFLNQPPMQMAS